MKVVREKVETVKDSVTYSQVLPRALAERVDKIKEREGLSRNALVVAILTQALDDKNFVLKLPEKA